MRLIENLAEYQDLQCTVQSVVPLDIRKPWDAVLNFPKTRFRHLYHHEFLLAHPIRLSQYKRLCDLNGNDRFFLIVLAIVDGTDPVRYFLEHIGRYPAYEISVHDQYQTFKDEIWFPKGAVGNSIAIQSQCVAAFSPDLTWFFLMERDSDLAVIATTKAVPEAGLELDPPGPILPWSTGFPVYDEVDYESLAANFKQRCEAWCQFRDNEQRGGPG